MVQCPSRDLIQTRDILFLSLHRPPKKGKRSQNVNLRHRETADSLVYRLNCSLNYRDHAHIRPSGCPANIARREARQIE